MVREIEWLAKFEEGRSKEDTRQCLRLSRLGNMAINLLHRKDWLSLREGES